MCLIAVKGSGVALPKEKYMLHAEKRNSDGIGIMYWKPGTTDVCIKKDFNNANELNKWLKDNIKIEDILVIHFRLATHGLKDIGNRHPFPITKNAELLRKPELFCQIAVAHNGIISQYNRHPKLSDTQKFVLDILADDCVKNNIESEAIQKMINSFIDGDKLAILRNDGLCIRFGEWEENLGIYYSNDGYKPSTWGFGQSWNRVSDWRDNYQYGNITEQLEDKSSFSTEKGYVTNQDKGFVGVCDGCNEKKYVRYMEIEENAYALCKQCRKSYKKGKLALTTEIEAEVVCDSCGEFVPEKELTPVDGTYKVCKECYKAYSESGVKTQDY